MAYAEYQPRSSSQQPRASRYYFSDADDDVRAPRYAGAWTDRGRSASRRSWAPRQDELITARPNSNYGYSTGPAPNTLSPYYTSRHEQERSRRHRDVDEDDRRSVRSSHSADHRSRSRRQDEREAGRSRSRATSQRSRSAERGSKDTLDKAKEQAREAYEQTREVLDKTFDTRTKGVAAGVVGAILGGAVGKRLGDKDDGHALAGALIGGLGLNMLENQVHRRKEAKREEELMLEEEAEYRRSRSRRSRER